MNKQYRIEEWNQSTGVWMDYVGFHPDRTLEEATKFLGEMRTTYFNSKFRLVLRVTVPIYEPLS